MKKAPKITFSKSLSDESSDKLKVIIKVEDWRTKMCPNMQKISLKHTIIKKPFTMVMMKTLSVRMKTNQNKLR